MQDKRVVKCMPISDYANSVLPEIKLLSSSLKSISKSMYEQNNNHILDQLLLAKDQEMYQIIIKILKHLLQLAQYKALVLCLISILNNTIACLKTFQNTQLSPNNKQSLQLILSFSIDVLIAVSNQHSNVQQTSLRVLQTTFSLIDYSLMPYFSFSLITKMFSICFQFCSVINIVQNISVSALFSLVESLFKFGSIQVSFQLLKGLLQYLFEEKKFLWIKAKQVRGLIWDLVVIGIRNFSPNHIIALEQKNSCKHLLTKMYQVILDSIFLKKSKTFYNYVPVTQNHKNLQNTKIPTLQYSKITDFVRIFKAFVVLSTSLSIQSCRIVQKEYVSFRTAIPKLAMVYDLQRNSRMYIFLQAICQLLLNQYDMPLSLDNGIVFMDILTKIAEELCWSNENEIKVNWQHNQNYLDKVINEQPIITDGDFVRLIKNTIVNLRMKFQKDQDLLKNKLTLKQQKYSQRSMNSPPQNMENSKKWQIFVKYIVRIIRYLSSLNFKVDQTQQDPTRKIILQLQYWFLACPATKAKNMILQQLLITSNVLNNRMQAVKVSQSIQIGSNILYGYYENLDGLGLSIILKMMAGMKADWEQGKSFEELDQVYNLVVNIFSERKLVKSQANFLMTIQALVQCASSLLADIQQPKEKQFVKGPVYILKRNFKMIEFLLQKLVVVATNNLAWASRQWNFITGFLITLCINKDSKIKQQSIKSIGSLVSKYLKSDLGPQLDSKKQLDILSLYQQLAKSKQQTKQFQLLLINQLKLVMPLIKQQNALMNGFRIVKTLSDSKKQVKNTQIVDNIHELQQIMIKQCLFRISQTNYLKNIVQSLQIKASGKNQEYRLISLLWAVSDYFRKITPQNNISNEYIQLWQSLFKTLWIICQSSKQYQTKQSAIHTTTQILAQITNILPFDFIITIITRYYQQMVLLLLGMHGSSLPQSQKSSQTAKICLKNYIKIFKKLITQQIKTQNKTQIAKIFNKINDEITKYITLSAENISTSNITSQLLLQLLNFISTVYSDQLFQQQNIKKKIIHIFNACQTLTKLSQQSQNTKIDTKSNLYKKKIKTLLDKIRETQNAQIIDEVNPDNQKQNQKK